MPETLIELFDRAVERHGTNAAITVAGKHVSYLELEQRANSLANFILSHGATKGSSIPILAEDTIEIITAVIAILKAGCVFVPLDPSIPLMRLEAIISEINPQLFIVESGFLRALGEISVKTGLRAEAICVGREDCPAESQENLRILKDYAAYFNETKPAITLGPDDNCYIYFTSGSTGRPKGIAGRLKGLDHYVRWEIETLGLGEGVRVSQLLQTSFDASLRDIFVPLCAGGTVCVPPDKKMILDARRLVDWINGQGITLIHCVPSLFRTMLNEELRPEYFPALKYVMLLGEPLLPSDVGRWAEVFGERIQLVNLYGPTETTLSKFFYFVKPSDKDLPSIPLGRPMEGAKALLVDEKGKPCPTGVIGEIYIRTPYRSLGYYNQPELTKQSFIQNPFSQDPLDIVYKTGDLGRLLRDGNYEFIGRRDQQVKIRGQRVELGEIESLLLGFDGVKEVAVVPRDDGNGSNYLCAYVALGKEIEAAQMRDYLSCRLPEYMLPSAWMVMNELPKTLSGKVNRRALPDPARTSLQSEKEYVAPRTPVEQAVADVWSELLKVERVSIHDNFFFSGGHSLLGTQLLSRLGNAFSVELPLRCLFESPTVAGLALTITQRMIEQESEEEIAHIIEEIKNLPDDSLESRLSWKG